MTGIRVVVKNVVVKIQFFYTIQIYKYVYLIDNN